MEADAKEGCRTKIKARFRPLVEDDLPDMPALVIGRSQMTVGLSW